LTLRGSDGAMVNTRQTGGMIGHADINIRRAVVCLDDPGEGIVLFRTDSWDRVRSYPIAAQKSMRPRQVAFAEDCKVVLGASDHGVVYVFDRKSGKEIDQLRTGSHRILAVTVSAVIQVEIDADIAYPGNGE
ncbi:hypothetical protein H0H93_003004, partial [Arthromyces matolae]